MSCFQAKKVYYTPPYTNGGIEKASVNLADYGKTQVLNPGETETLSFTLMKEDMASYDDLGVKTANGGYVLEKGEYTVSIRSDSHHVLDSKTFTVEEDILYDVGGRSSDFVPAINHFDSVRGEMEYLSRKDGFSNFAAVAAAIGDSAYQLADAQKNEVLAKTVAAYDYELYNREEDEKPELNTENGLTLADMIGRTYDDPDWDKLLSQMSIKEMITLVSAGGWHTEEIKSIGKAATSDSDGPAGMNNLITKAQGTAFPVEVLMAQTWNKALAYAVGQAIGGEFSAVEAYGWYAPAVNTHRSAFGGRNFEYFSEDPVLAGAFAAEEIRGAQALGVYTYTKHFALNEQETNRETILLTWANEQSMREIYLKPFEMAVKDGGSKAMMSAFNWLGTTPSMANSALLQDILRGEWGFTGMVISDYDGPYGFMITDNAIRNGNDLMLSMSAKKPEIKDRSATITLALRQASKNILYTVVNSGNYVDPASFADEFGTQVTEGTISSGLNNLDRTFLTIDGILLAILILVEVLLIAKNRKKQTKFN